MKIAYQTGRKNGRGKRAEMAPKMLQQIGLNSPKGIPASFARPLGGLFSTRRKKRD
jgi:hypothetical protein